MATPIINSQMDTINSTLDTLEDDLVALRPLIKELKTTLDATLFTESGSGAVASFDDGANGVPVRSLSVAITPIQSGTGDPAPDNIRPISGHTEVNVTRTGLNLFDANSATIYYGYLNGTNWLYNNGSRSVILPCLPNTKYCAYVKGTAPAILRVGSTANDLPTTPTSGSWAIALEKAFASGSTGLVTYTTGASARYLVVQMSATGFSDFLANLCLSFSSEETDGTWEAFGNTYPISLGQTVYGGTLNVKTGVLTIDREYHAVSEFTSWLYSDNGNFFYQAITGKKAGTVNIICDEYKTKVRGDWTSGDDCVISGNNSTSQVYIRDSRYTTPADFKANVTASICYELATPTTVQLTPTEVATLLGQNNIWADTGDILEVTIRCDTALYLQKLVG